ncbi:MAG: hypothetical protein CBC12_05275 [Candidatus Puniceispirillum sp. TMED52]|nr:MAG: hypothetical protein CBC12_05275 [Candidatus Puniceispirillum sp. TMED52]
MTFSANASKLILKVASMTNRTARRPGFSLCELMIHGFINEEDVSLGGIVDEAQRIRAESLYASWLAEERRYNPPRPQRPQTARVLTPRPPQTTARAHTARGPRTTSTAPVHRPRFVRPTIPSPATTGLPAPSAPPNTCPPPATQSFAQTLGEKACCICRDREKTHAPYPCFHMCMCEICANLVDQCPLCRGPVATVHRIFT